MERFWLKSYPAGVPADINPAEFASLKELIDTGCRRYAARAAYSNFGRTITFAELDSMSRAFGAWLLREARLKPGDRIALMMPNILQYPVALFGALRAGLTVVNTNPLYTHRELEHQLKDSGAKAIVVFENAAHVLQECIAETDVEVVIVTGIGDLLGFPKGPIVNFMLRSVRKQVKPYVLPEAYSFLAVLEQGKWVNLPRVPVLPDHIAFLQYTGGTTGISKGAILTHRNMVANVLQASAWIPDYEIAFDEPQTVVGALPLYHIFALNSVALQWLYRGGHAVLITNPRDMKAFVADLRRHRCSVYYGVNTLFNGLLNTPEFASVDFSKVVLCGAGGMALQGAVAERWLALTGVGISQGWGLTETSPVATSMPRHAAFNNSIGLPIPSTEIAVVDDGGRFLATGEVGELCVRGPQVMAGYWNRPDETRQVMLDGGWLRTGDIGRMDADGYVYIEDRKKDMILVSGFNVYPNEVEGVMARHPGVVEVAAVAQPDEHSGEVVALVVVPRDPALTPEALITFARAELTSYKVPRHVYFRTELPKTNVGKILRRALRDELAKKA